MCRYTLPETITTAEVARRVGVTTNTVRRWVREGILRPDVQTPGGHSRYRPSTVRRLQRRMRIAA